MAETGEPFMRAKLIANIQATSQGGNLAAAQFDDGRIAYGEVRMVPDLDRVYINFREAEDFSGGSNSRIEYLVMDLGKTEGLKAECHDLSSRNLFKKALSTTYNMASALAGASRTGPVSPSDEMRDRGAQYLQNEAMQTDRAGNIRSCYVPAGTQFYVVQTGVGK